MRNGYIIVVFILFLVSCKNDSDGDMVKESQYVIVNQVDGHGNISLYDNVTKTLNEKFFTLESNFSRITSANKKGNFLFATSGYSANKLTKIDLTTGTQVKQVESWLYVKPIIDFHQSNVIVCYPDYDGTYSLHTKIYDENLSLKDSVTLANVFEMYDGKVNNNKWFCSTAVVDEGFFISVLDLNTKSYLKPIELSARCVHLISLNETQLLGVQVGRLFILDTQSLKITKSIETNFEMTHVAFDAESNDLYFLAPNAQPAAMLYGLHKFNLLTEEASRVTEYNEFIYNPIIYDDYAKAIVSGSALKIFSREGKVLDQIASPATTSQIFVK